MQRIKLMLLSLALFAVVGGALAFKAKFMRQFCTTSTEADVPNTNLNCSNYANASTYYEGAETFFVATTTYDNNRCQTRDLKCTTTSRRLTED